MNASRSNRSPRISERALMEFMETLDEMMFVCGRHGPDDMTFHLMRRLDRPLRHICMDAGIPEVYEKHHHRMRGMFELPIDKEPKQEPVGADQKK